MNKNTHVRTHPYHGPVRAVILDWAGTAVDYGCFGPVAVFQKAFNHYGIQPDVEDTRKPMGNEKKEHVRQMLAMPKIIQAWQEKYGVTPTENDVEAIFAKVQELMPEVLAEYAEPVPGCVEALEKLREKNISIGSCTGYSRPMMTKLIPRAASMGFSPDCLVTSDEVPEGRPLPWMCWLNCMKLNVFPPEAVVKVGDTFADIKEGINAGHWTVAVTQSSNALGLTREELEALDPEELQTRETALAKAFSDAGVHFVISDISHLPVICEDINQLLSLGIRP